MCLSSLNRSLCGSDCPKSLSPKFPTIPLSASSGFSSWIGLFSMNDARLLGLLRRTAAGAASSSEAPVSQSRGSAGLGLGRGGSAGAFCGAVEDVEGTESISEGCSTGLIEIELRCLLGCTGRGWCDSVPARLRGSFGGVSPVAVGWRECDIRDSRMAVPVTW